MKDDQKAVPSSDRPAVFFFSMFAWGHIMPMKRLIGAFAMRGFQTVTYATEEFRQTLAETGTHLIDCSPYLSDLPPRESTLYHTLIRQLLFVEKIDERIQRDLDLYRPCFALVDGFSFWGKLLAEKYHLPFAISSASIPFNLVTLTDWGIEFFQSLEPGIEQAQALLDDLARKGFPKKSFLSLLLLDDRQDCIFQQTKAFLPCPQSYDLGRIFFAAACCSGEESGSPGRGKAPVRVSPKGGRPLIFVTMGTVSSSNNLFWFNCIRAFAGKNVDVVMVVWKYLDPVFYSYFPENITLLPEADQRSYLPYADAMLCHGGLNTISDGLLSGVPMAFSPSFADQYANVRLAQSLGVGIRLANTRPETIWQTIEKLLTEGSYRESAQRLGREMRDSHTAGEAVDWIIRRMEGA